MENSKELATTEQQAEQLPQVQTQAQVTTNIFHGFNQEPSYRADASYKQCVFLGYDLSEKKSFNIGNRIEGFIELSKIKTWYPQTEAQKQIDPYLYLSLLIKLTNSQRIEVNIKICNLSEDEKEGGKVEYSVSTSQLIAFQSFWNINNATGQYICIKLSEKVTKSKKGYSICITRVWVNGHAQNMVVKNFDDDGNVVSLHSIIDGNEYTNGVTKKERQQRENEILSDLLHHFGIAKSKEEKEKDDNLNLLKFGSFFSKILNPSSHNKEMDELPF